MIAVSHAQRETAVLPAGRVYRSAGCRGRLTLQAAKDQGPTARAYDVPSSATAGASFSGRDTGYLRLVVDEDRGVIVGATFTGTDVADWLHPATIA